MYDQNLTLKPLAAPLYVVVLQVFASRASSHCKHDMGPLSWLNAENLERMPTSSLACGHWDYSMSGIYAADETLVSSDGKLKIAKSNPAVAHSCSKVVDLGQTRLR